MKQAIRDYYFWEQRILKVLKSKEGFGVFYIKIGEKTGDRYFQINPRPIFSPKLPFFDQVTLKKQY